MEKLNVRNVAEMEMSSVEVGLDLALEWCGIGIGVVWNLWVGWRSLEIESISSNIVEHLQCRQPSTTTASPTSPNDAHFEPCQREVFVSVVHHLFTDVHNTSEKYKIPQGPIGIETYRNTSKQHACRPNNTSAF